MTVHGVHDAYLVTLSLVIAVIASFTALSLAGRVREARNRARRVWLAAAAVALGGGIWSMHFVAMLAFSVPGMPMTYAIAPTIASLALAIGFTGCGFALIDWSTPRGSRTVLAGCLIGAGVASMHYLGMAAMRLPAALSYHPGWVAVSIIVAVAAATTAVWLVTQDQKVGRRAAASAVMGAAIAGMHYSGMHAATFRLAPVRAGEWRLASLDQVLVAVAISLVTLLVLTLALAAAKLERVLRGVAQREARLRFFGDLNDRLFAAGGATDAMAAATTLLGIELGASRCAYADVDVDGDRFWIGATTPHRATPARPASTVSVSSGRAPWRSCGPGRRWSCATSTPSWRPVTDARCSTRSASTRSSAARSSRTAD